MQRPHVRRHPGPPPFPAGGAPPLPHCAPVGGLPPLRRLAPSPAAEVPPGSPETGVAAAVPPPARGGKCREHSRHFQGFRRLFFLRAPGRGYAGRPNRSSPPSADTVAARGFSSAATVGI